MLRCFLREASPVCRRVSLAIVLLASAALADPQSEWRPDGVVDGMRVDRRDVAGSSFDELRVTGTSRVSLTRLCDALYPKRVDDKIEGRFLKRELLRETERDRWTYEQVSVPVVSNRDYVMHVRLEKPASSGRCEVSFQTENDGVRPPPPGFVRIAAIRGRWQLAPTPDA
jgi:hypothetical protein